MIEFDYNLDYKNTLFMPNDKRYRIGRGEQGVLLVRPTQMTYANIGVSRHLWKHIFQLQEYYFYIINTKNKMIL